MNKKIICIGIVSMFLITGLAGYGAAEQIETKNKNTSDIDSAIWGSVIDSRYDGPERFIEDAEVFCEQISGGDFSDSTITDDKGRYKFIDLPKPGLYKVYAETEEDGISKTEYRFIPKHGAVWIVNLDMKKTNGKTRLINHGFLKIFNQPLLLRLLLKL